MSNEIIYRITSGPNRTFSVEVSGRGVFYGGYGFKSRADAQAWIKLKRRVSLAPDVTWIRGEARKKA